MYIIIKVRIRAWSCCCYKYILYILHFVIALVVGVVVFLDPVAYLADEVAHFVEEEGEKPGQSQGTPHDPHYRWGGYQEHTQCHLHAHTHAHTHKQSGTQSNSEVYF